MPDTKVSAQEAIDAFLDRMITDKGVEGLSQEDRAQTRRDLRERLDELVNEEMIVALSDEEIIELDARMSAGMTDAELEDFLMNSGADFNAAAIAAFDKLRNEYLGLEEGATTATDMTTNGEENTNE